MPKENFPSEIGRKLRDLIRGPLKEELEKSPFFKSRFLPGLVECLEKLGKRKIEKIVCFGLGTFHLRTDRPSRVQLSMLLSIFDYLNENGSPVSPVIDIYDPLFEKKDKETLVSFTIPKFELLQQNEFCAMHVQTSAPDKCILFYMIHLDKSLYNNLLAANWNNRDLRRVVVMGNSFQQMIDCELTAKGRAELGYLDALVVNFERSRRYPRKSKKQPATVPNGDEKALIEIPLDDSEYHRRDVFNNLSIHLVNDIWLAKRPSKVAEYLQTDWTPSTGINSDPKTDHFQKKLSRELRSLAE